MRKSKKYFVFPTTFESGVFRRKAAYLRRDDLAIRHCGVGWVAVADFLQLSQDWNGGIWLCGFCGKVTQQKPNIEIFTYLSEIIKSDYLQSLHQPHQSPVLHFFPPFGSHEGFICSDRVLGHSEKLQAAIRFPQASYVEMEFFPFWIWARQSRVSFRMVRVVSDDLENDLPLPAHYWLDPKSGQPSGRHIALGLMRHPQALATMGKFIQRAFCARRILSDHLLANYI